MKNRTLKVLKLVLENLPAIITALATLLIAIAGLIEQLGQ